MLASRTTRDSQTVRLTVKILTVDTAASIVEGIGKDGGGYHISPANVPTAFTWPKVGEFWMIYQENNFWKLGGRVEGIDDNIKLGDLEPGDTLIKGKKVYFDAESIQIGTLSVPRRFTSTINHNGVTSLYTISHNLNTKDLIVQVYRSDVQVQSGLLITLLDNNSLSLNWSVTPPNATTSRVVIIG